ncbi:hypothetical protein GT039_00495 [Streptomyces sp. SID2955]|nr:hypothetical protein [Streptomyces sp. SID2955]
MGKPLACAGGPLRRLCRKQPGCVLNGQKIDGRRVALEALFQFSAVLDQLLVLALELIVFAETLRESLRSGTLGRHARIEQFLEVQVLVGETPPLDAGLDRQRGDAEAPARSHRDPGETCHPS